MNRVKSQGEDSLDSLRYSISLLRHFFFLEKQGQDLNTEQYHMFPRGLLYTRYKVQPTPRSRSRMNSSELVYLKL